MFKYINIYFVVVFIFVIRSCINKESVTCSINVYGLRRKNYECFWKKGIFNDKKKF